MIDKGSLWFIIFALGIGSFMLRFLVLGVGWRSPTAGMGT